MAAPAQPAAGRHAAVQPEVHIWGEASSVSSDTIVVMWALINWNMVTSVANVLLVFLCGMKQQCVTSEFMRLGIWKSFC